MGDAGGSLPALAIPYRESAVSPLRVAEAARDTWRTLWLFDRTIGGSDTARTFLNRFGTVVDITGLAATEAAAKLAEHEPRGITAFADDDIMRVAQIAQVLELSYHSVEAAERLTNKVAQRQALQMAGLPVPGFWSVPARQGAQELDALVGEVGYPVIVKPQRGAGSRDTVRAGDADALRAALDGVDEPWIVEEILHDGWPRADRFVGDYVSVESVVSRGRASHAAVSGKTALADPFRETGSFIPADLSAEIYSEVLDVATRAIAAMGITVGMVHTEIKLTPDGPRVIEVNGRLAGGGIPDTFALASGQSAHRLVGRLALGADVQFASPLPSQCVAYLWEVQPPMTARRLTRLDNLDEARQLPGVHEIRLNRHVGDELDWRAGTDGALFSLVGVADDHAAMIDTIQLVDRTVEVEYDSA
jgi:biotin carboxylase